MISNKRIFSLTSILSSFRIFRKSGYISSGLKSRIMRNRMLTLRFLAEPTDVNFGGKVHGGMVMKWIDQAGYACATQWSGNYCVTVYVGGIQFYKPIKIGSIVEVEAKVIYTGKTSICLLYTSPSPRDATLSRMPSSA